MYCARVTKIVFVAYHQQYETHLSEIMVVGRGVEDAYVDLKKISKFFRVCGTVSILGEKNSNFWRVFQKNYNDRLGRYGCGWVR